MLLTEGTNLHTRVTFFGVGRKFSGFFGLVLGSHTTNINKMSRHHATPSFFAPYCHGNICHDTKSWLSNFPYLLQKRPVAGLQLLRLVPFLGALEHDPLRNREMGRAQALGGCQSFKKCNNQPKDSIVGGGIV
jgi:hypothetical protein